MKDKEKQIEEMAKLIKKWHEIYGNEYTWIAEHLAVNGVVRLPEDSVVLSREEAERFRGQTINIAKVKAQASKETTEKIYKDIRLFLDDKTLAIITRYFKEILGVEIKE